MTDETKKLFDAPWKVRVCEKGNPEFESVLVAKKTGWLVGRDMEYKTAKRVARLPELYDAMENILFTGYCLDCRIFDKLKRCDFDAGCPKKNKRCPGDKAWKLLGKVRDGE